MTTRNMQSRLIWIDCEMTGLDVNHATLVEIACIITDGDLQVTISTLNAIVCLYDVKVT